MQLFNADRNFANRNPSSNGIKHLAILQAALAIQAVVLVNNKIRIITKAVALIESV